MPPVLELRDITKAFPGVLANDHVNVDLMEGEIHCLLGENGAGKTTLMNILYGLYKPDSGEIIVRGNAADIAGPNDAIARGIGMVHQHFMLVPVMTVTENVMLGVEETKNGMFLDRAKVAERIREISQLYGLEVDPDAYIKDLPVGIQQRVEIIKVLRSLVEKGKSIIFITHKLKEVMALANRITVLRNGQTVGTVTPGEVSAEKLASMMVGRDVTLVVPKKAAKPTDPALEVRDLYVADERGHEVVHGVSFDVKMGEVLGIAGVQGNGQTQLVYALTGLLPFLQGEIRILDAPVKRSAPRNILERGVAHIPEDRQKHGLILSFPIYDNMMLCTYYQPPFARGVALQEKKIYENAEKLVEQYDVRTPSIFVPVSSLSGGNQQKVIVAREFSRPIKLLIASQPTRGLDVGSIEYIHSRIVEKRDEGTAVLLVSSELDEILALSDRIAVMYRGQIVAIVPSGQASREYIGLLMAGIHPDEALKSAPARSGEVERVF
ncbi:MAG: heme ABC transporter ATP-binding protein [Anaerolineae bacterium UTCFX3]|nr:MAG: heme ABC transporter ATP-binding protein [Anaerolineae bacterium UTCFX3]